MKNVFISYRRVDSPTHAGRLYDRLCQQLGDDRVFMDVDGIAPGENFIDVISDRLSACTVFLAVIGPGWLNAGGKWRRRLYQPRDFVRLEIVAALSRPILVIPVLVGGAKLPAADDLPDSIAALTGRNALSVSDEGFRNDTTELTNIVRAALAAAAPMSEAERQDEKKRVEAAITADRDDRQERKDKAVRWSSWSAAALITLGALSWAMIQYDPFSLSHKDEWRFGRLTPAPVPHPSDQAAYAAIGSQSEGGLSAAAIPKPRGGSEPVLTLADVWGRSGSDVAPAVKAAGKIIFHAAGSTGNIAAERNGPATLVADQMSNDFRAATAGTGPSFLFLLGDVIYNFGEAQYYTDQFYLPYQHYPAPILAVAGNHDGMVAPGSTATTLQAFRDNFCAQYRYVSGAAPEPQWDRPTQIQPGVYFTFDAPFVRIIALYSNVLEGPGVISGSNGRFSRVGDSQLAFLETALARVKTEKFGGAVIIAVHHDPYSGIGGHGGSAAMLADLDNKFNKTGVWPHAVLSGHSHNYQRFTRKVGSMQIPFVVAGNGGYGMATLFRSNKPALPAPLAGKDVVLESVDDQHFGFLRLTVDAERLRIEHQPISTDAPSDIVTVDLKTRQLIR